MKKIILLLVLLSSNQVLFANTTNKGKKMNIETIEILQEYKKTFRGYEIPKTLVRLAEFDNKVETESYGESFYLRAEENIFNYWLDSNSTSKEQIEAYANRVIVFANADGTGGFYAFWARDKQSDLEEAPIIAYGSEGAVKIVAKNLKGLIKILSYGSEGMDGNYGLDGYDSYDEFLQYNPNFLAFRTWMKEELGIEPIKNWKVPQSDEVDAIIEDANKALKVEFDTWQYQFYKSSEELEKEYQTQEKIRTDKLEFKKIEILSRIEQNATVDDYLELVQHEENGIKKVEYLKKALELDENNTDVLYELGHLAYGKDAVAYYHKVEALLSSPIKTELYYNLAINYNREDEYDNALKYYKLHIGLNPRPNRYGDSDVIALCKKLNLDPIDVYEKVVNVAKTQLNFEALYDLYLEKKDYKNAMHSLQRFFKVATAEDWNYGVWGSEFFDNGYDDYALEVLKEGANKLEDSRDKGYLYWRVVEVYEKLKDKKKVKEYQDLAIKYYKLALEKEKDNDIKARLSEDIADIYEEQDEKLLYIEYTQKAFNYEQDRVEKSNFLYHIAETYKELEEYDKALQYAKESYELDNDETVFDFIEELRKQIDDSFFTKLKRLFTWKSEE